MVVVLTAKNVVATYNDGSKLFAYLKDIYGNAIAGVPVKFVIGDVVKTITTITKGKASIYIDKLNPGSYNATITFESNELYDNASTIAMISVHE